MASNHRFQCLLSDFAPFLFHWFSVQKSGALIINHVLCLLELIIAKNKCIHRISFQKNIYIHIVSMSRMIKVNQKKNNKQKKEEKIQLTIKYSFSSYQNMFSVYWLIQWE